MQSAWIKTLSESAQTQVLSRQAADHPRNAILLRADVHSLFDDYQWSIWVCTMLVLPYDLLFNLCGSLTRVHTELFASRSRVLQLWNITVLQIFDHQIIWVPLSRVTWN
jgi:HNH endonuclease